MWLKGDNHYPSFTYTLIEQKGKPALLDEVKYTKYGKQKTITGYDRLTVGKSFIWRGKGWLCIAKSRWQVKFADPMGQWAIIYFSKTMFTPEGVDIICRNKRMDENTLDLIKEMMQKDTDLKHHAVKMVTLQ